MAYSEPSVAASSQSFATLQTLSAGGYVDAVASLDSATAARKELVHKLHNTVQAAQPFQRLEQVIDSYLSGDPVAVATVDTELQDLAYAYKAVLTAISEIGALVDANVGTVAYTGMTTGIGMGRQKRTF